MKKISLLFLIVIMINGCVETSRKNDPGETDTPEFEALDLGQVDSNRYANEGFNLTFTFPKEWEAVDAKIIHKQKIEAEPDFLNHIDIESVDTINVLSLYLIENGQRIRNYAMIEQNLTAEDSIQLRNADSKEEYYRKTYPHLIEQAGLFLELENMMYKPQFQDAHSYLERVRTKISEMMLWNKIATKNYNEDDNYISEIYNFKKLSDSTILMGFDTHYTQGSSLTGISLKKGDFMWNFQLFYFNEEQKEALIGVVESLKLMKQP